MRSLALSFLVVSALAIPTRVALAGDIPTITVTEAGPDKTIPADAAFYIAGTAKDAKRVQVVILRTGTPWIGSSHHRSCEAVDAKLGTFVGGTGKLLPELPAQTTTADKVWQRGDSRWSVRISPSWKPADGQATGDFKILIDHDEFFGAGYGYCFYIYVDKEKPDYRIADAVMASVVAATSGCSEAKGCEVKRAAIDAKIDEQAQDPAVREQLKKAVTESVGAARTMATDAREVGVILDHWFPGATSKYNVPVFVGGAFARAVAALLAYNNQLQPVIDPNKRGLVGYFTKDGKINVAAVGFVASGQVRVATDLGGKAAVVLDLKTAGLGIPDTSSSLRDLVELAEGRLPLGKEYLEPGAYHARLGPVLNNYSQALSPDQVALLGSARDSLNALHQTLIHIHDEHDGKPRPAEGTKGAILWDLGDWLETTVEAPCAQPQRQAWGLVSTPESGCRAAPGTLAGWATYINKDGTIAESPLAIVISDLGHFKDAQARWLGLRPTIQDRSTTAFTHTISTTIQVTRETWVFSYLSPVIGYAAASPVRNDQHEGITLPYYAVQLHLKPNPAHLPTGGIGMFALELGASPGIGAFGPDHRYRGLGNISPVFVGLAVHLIPFTAVSAGVLIGERRTSTVGQEDYRTFCAGYLGLTVDVNLPQLIVGTKTTTTTTAAASATTK